MSNSISSIRLTLANTYCQSISYNMIALATLSILLVSSASAYNPDLIESPPYTVSEIRDGYEIRDYPALKWVSTDGYDFHIHDSPQSDDMFNKLFNYIDGQNSEGAKIDMTAPVIYFIVPGAGPNCESNFTMSFFIPQVYQVFFHQKA